MPQSKVSTILWSFHELKQHIKTKQNKIEGGCDLKIRVQYFYEKKERNWSPFKTKKVTVGK